MHINIGDISNADVIIEINPGSLDFTGLFGFIPIIPYGEFIQRIKVHAPDKSTGKRVQQIDIYFNAVGVKNIPTSEELDAMIAEYRAQQKQQDHVSA